MVMRLDQLRNADLNLLIYFVVLVEEKNVSRAAKRLRLTQSALSRVLQRLRTLFQDDLLVRSHGGYEPTSRGLEILKRLSVLLPQIDELISGKEFNPAEEDAKFRITAADSLAYVYGPLFAARHEETPNLVFEFSLYDEDRYEKLEANSIDLVLDADFRSLPNHLHKELLFEESLVCAVARDSPYKQRLSLAQYLAGEHIAVNVLDQRQPTLDIALAEIGVRRRCVFIVPYFGVALGMVERSHLIATLPRSMCELLVDRRTIRLIRPPSEAKPFRYVMVWHQRQQVDPRHIWLRRAMKQMTDNLLTRIRRSEAAHKMSRR